jgi:hypothetical protein
VGILSPFSDATCISDIFEPNCGEMAQFGF